jgi:phage shock protein C
MTKKLYRSKTEKMLGGVSGGLADYFEVDVTLVRLIWLISLLSGVGFLLYFFAWILIPLNPAHTGISLEKTEVELRQEIVSVDPEEMARSKAKNQRFIGIALIGIGGVYIINQIMPWFTLSKTWPLLFVIIGLVILLRGKDGGKA